MVSEKDMTGQASAPGHRRFGEEAGALDVWLHREVAQRFAAALSEPVPAELVLLAAKLFH
jgi:hypothetical protein